MDRILRLCCAISLLSLLSTAQTWNKQTPRLKWEGRPLGAADADNLLAHVCSAGVQITPVGNEKGFQCYSPPPIEEGAKMRTMTFDPSQFSQPKPASGPEQTWFTWLSTVTYGHFLGPSSTDAALSGWGGETHPDFSGGTLLLTKVHGEWQPVWYKHGIITRSCRKIIASTQRDLLLCEEEDGMIGHSYQILYVLDLTRPEKPWDAAVLVADSYVLMCREQQKQSIERIKFEGAAETDATFMTVFARHGRRKLTKSETKACAENRGPIVRDYRIDFILRDTLRPAPWSADVARLFSVR